MSIESIVAEIDSEISRLRQARALLSDSPASKKGPGRPRLSAVKTVAAAKPKRRPMSAAGRKRIAAAQKARWAKTRKAGSTKATAKSDSPK